jgi:hypothetical protein
MLRTDWVIEIETICVVLDSSSIFARAQSTQKSMGPNGQHKKHHTRSFPPMLEPGKFSEDKAEPPNRSLLIIGLDISKNWYNSPL